ncbi:MAG: hypothetical protein WCT26_00535 [Candidatus Buchananbacteria bacterium]|jgi:hypothetical protein
MPNFQKLVNLLKKTGDKAVILDESGEPGYVIMTVADYEDLILGKSGVSGLTEVELLDKINRDIAIWKDNQELRELSVDQYNFAKDLGDYLPEGNLSNFSDNDGNNLPNIIDEDRYYFEPVEG